MGGWDVVGPCHGPTPRGDVELGPRHHPCAMDPTSEVGGMDPPRCAMACSRLKKGDVGWNAIATSATSFSRLCSTTSPTRSPASPGRSSG